MRVEEFLSTMDALRFDTDLDETNPELRGMVTKVYPYLRKIYNMMYESGLISESKVNESKLQKFYVVDDGEVYNVLTDEDLVNYGVEKDQIVKVFTNMDMAFNYAENLNRKTEESNPDFSPAKGYYNESKVNEVHGVKKHNAPKDKRAAERKGNRDAEKDMLGDGFKSKNKIHKVKEYDRRDNKKVNIEDEDMNESVIKLTENDVYNIVTESVKRILKESAGDEICWGKDVEPLIAKLKEKFSEVIAPEEDEWGIKSTALESLISHLKYYYEHRTFDSSCFNAIYKMLDNYDFLQDEEVMNILNKLKSYC